MKWCGPLPAAGAVLVAVVACAGASSSEAPNRNAVIGEREDMRSVAGRFDGYMLITHCTTGLAGAAIAVVAGGETPFEFLAAPDSEALQERFRARVAETLRGIDVRATGFGAACHGGEPAFLVTLRDWHEVDRVVEKLTEWVARESLRGEIVVYVAADPTVL